MSSRNEGTASLGRAFVAFVLVLLLAASSCGPDVDTDTDGVASFSNSGEVGDGTGYDILPKAGDDERLSDAEIERWVSRAFEPLPHLVERSLSEFLATQAETVDLAPFHQIMDSYDADSLYVDEKDEEGCIAPGVCSAVPGIVYWPRREDEVAEFSSLTSAERIARTRAANFRQEEFLSRLAASASEGGMSGELLETAPDRVILVVALEEQSFELGVFRELHRLGADADTVRERIITQRRKQLALKNLEFEDFVHSRNGSVVSRFWLVNQLVVDIPLSVVSQMLEYPDLIAVYLADGEDQDDGRDGHVRRIALGVDWNPVIYDGSGGSGYSRTRVAAIESSQLLDHSTHTHPVFRRASGTSRIHRAKNCTASGCTSGSSSLARHWNQLSPNQSTHATAVVYQLAGGILDGQDPNFPDVEDRSTRSSLAPGTRINFYRAQNGGVARVVALQQTVTDGINVVNMSFSTGATCSDSSDSNGWRAELAAAREAGTVLITSAGNNGNAAGTGCQVRLPGTSPDVFTVGSIADFEVANEYATRFRAATSSVGSISIPGRGHARVVDILAPGSAANRPWIESANVSQADCDNPTGNPNNDACYHPNYVSIEATSYASPNVAAIAANVRHYLLDVGSSHLNPETIYASLALMGDGLTSTWTTYTDTSRYSGFGRLRYFYPSSAHIGGGGYFRRGSRSFVQDQVYYGVILGGAPVSSSYNGLKLAVFTLGTQHYADAAKLAVTLVDTCPSGGGGEQVLSTAIQRLGRSRLIVTNTSLLHGRCLAYRIEGVDVPETVRLAHYMYMYTNAEENHVSQ